MYLRRRQCISGMWNSLYKGVEAEDEMLNSATVRQGNGWLQCRVCEEFLSILQHQAPPALN